MWTLVYRSQLMEIGLNSMKHNSQTQEIKMQLQTMITSSLWCGLTVRFAIFLQQCSRSRSLCADSRHFLLFFSIARLILYMFFSEMFNGRCNNVYNVHWIMMHEANAQLQNKKSVEFQRQKTTFQWFLPDMNTPYDLKSLCMTLSKYISSFAWFLFCFTNPNRKIKCANKMNRQKPSDNFFLHWTRKFSESKWEQKTRRKKKNKNEW